MSQPGAAAGAAGAAGAAAVPFTPGPWAVENGMIVSRRRPNTSEVIGEVDGAAWDEYPVDAFAIDPAEVEEGDEVIVANARLIACAPALFEIVENLAYWHDHGSIDASWWDAAREAVAVIRLEV